MLMEEDIDDKFFYQYPDQPAILDAQRPYEQIISDTTTTSSGSPNGTTSSDGNAATSSSEETNNSSWPYDPLELSQLLRSPPCLDDMLFGGLVPDSPADEDARVSFLADAPAAGFQQSPAQFKGAADWAGAFSGQNGGSPGTQSSAVLNGPAEEKEAETKPAMFSAGDGGQDGLLSAFFSNGGDMDMLNSAFLKGMEEANKFLPTNNALLEAIPDKERGFTVKKKEVVANRTPTSGNGRGRKYRHDEDDDLEAETARSSKLMTPDNEETGAREMFDEIMLEEYEKCIQGIEELRLVMDSEAKKKSGKAARAKKSEAVDLRTMLVHCAQAVAAGDSRGATELLRQIKQHSGPTGDATQRLAHCFAEGLEARLAGTGSQVYQSLVAKRTSVVEFLKAYKLFMAACCFKKANFGSCARELGVPFKFHGVAAKLDTVRGEDLRIDPDEVLIVHCQCGLSNLMDDSVAVTTDGGPSPRDVVLRNIRDMRPDVFVEGVANGGYGAPFFVTRFREAMFFYSAHFDMLDATLPRDNDERLLIERDIIGRGALNVIACEGADRVLAGGVKKWSGVISTASTTTRLDGVAQRDLGDGRAHDGCDVLRRGTTRSRLKDGMSS
ncbi:unnamed protein product [Triticum turgidum subsp. durum]|uniref:Scarecrow-like protein 9 n=1 Tax=Triticum turgidum subsp. durum TaxID=4567 RepID=A0A9R0ZUA4_TRITD|nr:unnamed protein product [Triticum turgidum subsp. durum]